MPHLNKKTETSNRDTSSKVNLIHIPPNEIDSHLGKHEFEILLFTATWCGPCQALKQKGFPALFKKYATKDIIIYAVDGDECHDATPNPMDKYGIPGFPTCIFHHHGKIIDKPIQVDEDSDEQIPNGYIIGYAGDEWFLELVAKVI